MLPSIEFGTGEGSVRRFYREVLSGGSLPGGSLPGGSTSRFYQGVLPGGSRNAASRSRPLERVAIRKFSSTIWQLAQSDDSLEVGRSDIWPIVR